MRTPRHPDIEPTSSRGGIQRVPHRLEEKLEEACQRVEQIPVWRIVATARARAVRGGVAIRCVNDLGHAIELIFSHEDWAYAALPLATGGPR